jgi:hypothetical protein
MIPISEIADDNGLFDNQTQKMYHLTHQSGLLVSVQRFDRAFSNKSDQHIQGRVFFENLMKLVS